MSQSIRELIEIIQHTENVATRIRGVLDESKIYRTVAEEFAKSKKYDATIFLMTADGSKIRVAETSIPFEKVKRVKRLTKLGGMKEYEIDLAKSKILSRVLRDGKTVQASIGEVLGESFPRPMTHEISKNIGYEKRLAIVTPLKKHDTVIGALSVSSTELAEDYVPSVKNLASHISPSLELADEYAKRMKMEETLRQSEERLRGIFSSMTDGVTLVGLDGRILDCNDAVLRLHNVSKDEYVGRNVYDFVAPEDRERAIQEASVVLEKGFIRSEVKALKKGGGFFDAEINVTPLMDALEKPTAFLGVTRDITRRKQLRKQIRQLQEFLQLQIDRMPIALIVWDTEFRAETWNPAAVKMFGFSEKEALGKHPYDLIVPRQAQPHVDKIWRRLLDGDETAHSVNENITKDGRTIICSWTNTTLKKDDGTVIGVLSMTQDIAESMRLEEKLRKSENDYRSLAESLVECVYRADSETLFATYVNRAVEKLYGYTVEEWLKNPSLWENTIYPDDRERVFAELAEAMRKMEFKVVEYRIVRRDGVVRWVEDHVSLEKDEQGKLASVAGVVYDVTERKKAEEQLKLYSEHLEELVEERTGELRESEAFKNQVLESIGDAVLVINPDFKIIAANRAALEQVRMEGEEVVGKYCYEVTHHRSTPCEEPDDICPIWKMIETGKSETVENIHYDKAGNAFYVEVSASPIKDAEGNLIHTVYVARDITERKRLEEQLQNAKRLAVIGETAAMVGHDLRNPLQGIFGNVFLAKERLKALPEKVKGQVSKNLETIAEQVKYMDKIVSDLQDYARPLKPKLVPTDIRQLIDTTLSTINIPENIEFSSAIPADFPDLMVDPTLMRRVLTNLVVNAVQAMPKGGKLVIRAEKKGKDALIGVEDTGVGISMENMGKFFQPLFTTKPKGQGLGLPVCKRIVEAHGGDVSVESQVGRGTKFTIRIPLVGEVR